MLTKYAEARVIQASRGVMRPSAVRVAGRRTAHRAVFDYTPREGFIYVRSRAISSRCNDNFDEFPAAEIKQAYRTFVGKPVFVNHHNDDHRRARGVIIDAVLHEDVNPDGSPDTWAEVLMEVDAVKFPKLAKAILAGHIDRTSMGTDVAYSICSVCANKAATPLDYCKHIPAMKGQTVYRTTASGTKEPTLVREICYGLSFFENSLLVEDPADPTAFFLGVDDRGVNGGYEGNLKEALAARGGHAHAEEGIRRQAFRQHDERGDFGVARPSVRLASQVRQGRTRVNRRGVRLTRTAIGSGKVLVTRNAQRLAASLPQDARSAIYRVTKRFMRGEIAASKMQSPRGKYYHLHAYASGGIYIIGIEDRGDHDAVIWVGTHEDANKRFYKQISRGGGLVMTANRRRVAYGETIAPQEVDTMREEECPVCGNDDNYDGEQCQVCGYVTPPEEFQDPDLTKARETDLRNGVMPEDEEGDDMEGMLGGEDEMLEEGVPSDPGDAALLAEVNEVLEEVKQMLAPDGEVGQTVQEQVRQQLDELREVMGDGEMPIEGGEGVPVEGETMDEGDVDENPFGSEDGEGGAEEGDGEEDLPEFMTSEDGGDEEAGDEEGEDGEDEEDEEEEEDEEGGPVMRAKSAREGVNRRVSKERGMSQDRRVRGRQPVSRAVAQQRTASSTKRTPTRSAPRRAASRPRTTKDTNMSSTLKTLAEVKRLLEDVKRGQRSVQAQVSYIGRAAGLERQLASLRRRADAENPAQPVPEPAPVAPAMTTEEARDHTPVDLMTPGGSDVPGEGLTEDYRVDLTQPGGVHDVPLTDGGDVTAPVAGTTEPNSYDEMVTRPEVKARDLDTEVAYEESQPLFGGEAEKEARFVAALRLARLRIKAGIASGDDLAVATSIAQSRMSATAIRNETNTLEAVAKAAAGQRSAPSRTARRLVPQAARTAPSFRTEAAVNTAPEAPLAVTGDEFLWD